MPPRAISPLPVTPERKHRSPLERVDPGRSQQSTYSNNRRTVRRRVSETEQSPSRANKRIRLETEEVDLRHDPMDIVLEPDDTSEVHFDPPTRVEPETPNQTTGSSTNMIMDITDLMDIPLPTETPKSNPSENKAEKASTSKEDPKKQCESTQSQ